MIELQTSFERSWEKHDNSLTLDQLEAVVFALSTFVGLLQGYKTVKAHLPTSVEQLNNLSGGTMEWDKDLDHYGLLLIGHFKKEMGEQAFVIPMSSVTASGLQPLKWML